MNKKRFIWILMISIFITSLISVSAAAFSAGFYNIQNFFRGGWAGYDELLLFALLFILFTAAFTLALTKAFGESNRQIKTIAVIIALISALSIVATTDFGLEEISYIAFGLGFLLLVLLIQGILLKMGIKSKFAAFILALLIALFIILLLANVFSGIPDVGRIRGPHIGKFRFFDLDLSRLTEAISSRISGIDFEPVEIDLGRREAAEPAASPGGEEVTTTTPATTTTAPDTTTTAPDTTTTLPPREGGLKLGKLILIFVLIAALGAGAIGGPKAFKAARKKWKERERKPKEKEITEKDVEEIIDEIRRIMKAKMRTFGKIKEKVNKKEKLSEDLVRLFHQKIRDPAFRQEPGTPEFDALTGENKDVDKLLHLEKQLEKELKELMKIEVSLTEGKITTWVKIINEEYKDLKRETAPEDSKEAMHKINEMFNSLFSLDYVAVPSGLLFDVKRAIITYLSISKKEIEAEETMKKLTDHREVERWFKKGRYDELEKTSTEEIRGLEEVLREEEGLLVEGENSLASKIYKQTQYMKNILRLISFIKSKEEAEPEEAFREEREEDLKVRFVDVYKKLEEEKETFRMLFEKLRIIVGKLNAERGKEIIEKIEYLFKEHYGDDDVKRISGEIYREVVTVISRHIPKLKEVITHGINKNIDAVKKIAEEESEKGLYGGEWKRLLRELSIEREIRVGIRQSILSWLAVNLGELEGKRKRIKGIVAEIERIYAESGPEEKLVDYDKVIRRLEEEKEKFSKLKYSLNWTLGYMSVEKKKEVIKNIESLFGNKPFERIKKIMDSTYKGVEWVINEDIPDFERVIIYGIRGNMNAVIRIAEERSKRGFFFRAEWRHLAGELKRDYAKGINIREFVVNITNTLILGKLEEIREKIERVAEGIEKIYAGIEPRKEIKPSEAELTKFDEWMIREELKAERVRKRGVPSDYTKIFLGILRGIEAEREQIRKRIKTSRKAKQYPDKIKELMVQLNGNIESAGKTHRFEYLNAARDNIHDLLSLTSDSPVPVGYKEGKRKTPYNRAKEKAKLRNV